MIIHNIKKHDQTYFERTDKGSSDIDWLAWVLVAFVILLFVEAAHLAGGVEELVYGVLL